jgi:hypothetical protein
MKLASFSSILFATSLAGMATANAQIRITEVASWGSSTASYAEDWFELTNLGGSAVDLTGWKVDDGSALFTSAVALRGLTSIAPGQSVVFLESGASDVNDATKASAFTTAWFGGSVPFGYTLAFYGGSGIGLSGTSGDALNIYNAAGELQANVTFGAVGSVPTFFSFDNSSGQNNLTLTTLSVAGVNGAITSADETSVGSPGLTAVPEPEEYAAVLALLSVGAAAWVRRQQRR